LSVPEAPAESSVVAAELSVVAAELSVVAAELSVVAAELSVVSAELSFEALSAGELSSGAFAPESSVVGYELFESSFVGTSPEPLSG